MFIQTQKFIPYNDKLNSKTKELRSNMTAAEKKLWFEYLRGHEYRFIRQKVIGNYILDFFCQKLKLGIELDGETHLGNQNKEYDENRTIGLEKLGIKILRFGNDDVLYGLGEVERVIEKEIEKNDKRFIKKPFL